MIKLNGRVDDKCNDLSKMTGQKMKGLLRTDQQKNREIVDLDGTL